MAIRRFWFLKLKLKFENGNFLYWIHCRVSDCALQVNRRLSVHSHLFITHRYTCPKFIGPKFWSKKAIRTTIQEKHLLVPLIFFILIKPTNIGVLISQHFAHKLLSHLLLLEKGTPAKTNRYIHCVITVVREGCFHRWNSGNLPVSLFTCRSLLHWFIRSRQVSNVERPVWGGLWRWFHDFFVVHLYITIPWRQKEGTGCVNLNCHVHEMANCPISWNVQCGFSAVRIL